MAGKSWRGGCFILLSFLYVIGDAAASISLPELPQAVTNNAVASVETEQGTVWVSMMGLGEPKTHAQVHNKVWILNLSATTPKWQAAKPVPSSLPLAGRLASVAVGMQGSVYVFGGYTVDSEGHEVSSPDNYRFDVISNHYTKITSTPVAVDDAVALTYQDRYVYLISGWHNDGNVNLVQVYDRQTDRWQQASPFPGKAVFGHAGAIIDNTMLICDGVVVDPQINARRKFEMESACYLGVIDAKQIGKIDWQRVAHPTGVGRYRMAAGADQQKMVFAGGSTNAYNYNGIGYNGKPSEPDPFVWVFDLKSQTWKVLPSKQASMDHRGLISYKNLFWTVGGMAQNQQVLQRITQYTVR